MKCAERERQFLKYPLLRLPKPTDFLQAVALMAGYERRREALQRVGPPDRLPGLVCNRRDVLQLELDYNQLRRVERGHEFNQLLNE